MTPEQLSWSDGQWAIYLDCPIQEIPSIRKFMTRNFFPLIERDVITGKYNFVMTRISTSMAGTKRIMPMISDKKHLQQQMRPDGMQMKLLYQN